MSVRAHMYLSCCLCSSAEVCPVERGRDPQSRGAQIQHAVLSGEQAELRLGEGEQSWSKHRLKTLENGLK